MVFLTLDKPKNYFKLQKEEVIEVKWFSEKKLRKELVDSPEKFVKNIDKYIDLFYW